MSQGKSALEALKEKWQIISALGYTGSLMTWDQETYMPPAGALPRARASAIVGRLAHEMSTSKEYGDLLDRAEKEVEGKDPEDPDFLMVKVARRDFERNVKVPPDLVARLREAEVHGVQVWQEARKKNDFAMFAPYLQRIVDLEKELAQSLGYKEHPYDALLDAFEPEMTTSEVRALFDNLRSQLVPLVAAISDRQSMVDDAILGRHVPFHRQMSLAQDLVKLLGYDLDAGRIDISAHPFTQGLASRDVRITVRVYENRMDSCLYAAAHECGHAVYEQGIPEEFEGTPLHSPASLGVHESQSRMWENVVCRGKDFLSFYYPRIQEMIPEQFGDVSFEDFYRAVNKSVPSLIRVEADEVTYNLHIMLRFDLELGLIEGSIDVNDLPRLWNAKMEEYLGIVPDSDANGVLQDMHWSSGLFGYFPTYTIGNVMSLQLYSKAVEDYPSIPSDLSSGDIGSLLRWMREHIHVHGRKYVPQELLERATGSRLDVGPYISYLRSKYGEIYGLLEE